MKSKCGAALLLMLVLVMACAGALADFTISFNQNLDGVTVQDLPPVQTIAENNTVIEPPNPSAAGYAFGGWYKSENCLDTEKYDFTTPVTSGFTLYAKWTPITYTVTFDLQDTSITTTIPDQTVTHGATVAAPDPAPSKTGYTFGGWYKEPTCATEFKFTDKTDADTVTSNITLYAKWSINQYTVTFNNNGHGVQPPQQMVNHGDTAKNPGDLVEQGWKFVRWYYVDAKNTNQTYDFSTLVTDPITLNAEWVQQHTVTFNMNGHGAVIKPVTVDDGGTVSAPYPAPTAEGYAFGGWYTDVDCSTGREANFTAAISSDTTYYAKWTANVKVKFQWQKAITNSGSAPTDPATVQLLGNGAAVSGANELTVQPNGEGEWIWLAADVKYSVMATNVPANYTAVCTQTAENTFLVTYVENEKLSVSITNTHVADTIDMVISKYWDDNNNQHRPRSIQVQVKKVDGNNKVDVGGPITLDESNQWTAHVTDLYMRENGTTIQYIIEEVGDVKGYKATCEIVVDAQGNYTVRVTNVLTGKVDISGEKIWEDDNDRDGIRPQSVQLKIYENSISPTTLVKNVIVDANGTGSTTNNWKWTVEDLPVYDEFGRPITYIVVEDPVPAGYTASAPAYITVGTTP